MKKKYMNPTMQVRCITPCMICTSVENIEQGDNGGNGDGKPAEVNERNDEWNGGFWD